MGASRQRIAAPLLILVLSLSIFQACLAARNLTLSSLELPGIIGVWNPALYPATQFRNDSVVGYFEVWPENLTTIKFKYFCEDPGHANLSLSNFSYSETEGRLDPRPYYDLGAVEHYQPYWKHWLFWKVDTRVLSYTINCEYNDLHDLYAYRFWKLTVRNGVSAAGVMQGIVQFIVAVVVILKWGLTFVKDLNNKERKFYMKAWFWNLHWGDFVSEVIHLFLLVLVGYSMMEAIGHSDLHIWRPTVMYNTGVIYSYLSLFAVLSSVFRQIAYAWMKPEKLAKFERMRKQGNLKTEGEIWYFLQNISDDWRWQRVFGQVGVFILMGTYLSFVDDLSGGMDQMAGLVLAAVVVACIWSYGVTAVVLFRSISHILAQVFPAFAKFATGRVSPIANAESEEQMEPRSLECMSCGSRRTSFRNRSAKCEV